MEIADYQSGEVVYRSDAVTLRRADLHGVRFPGADLRGLDLRGANLVGAQLQNTVLLRARLDGANLERADLCAARLGDWESRAPGAADLQCSTQEQAEEADVLWNQMDWWSRLSLFRGARVRRANLRGADLSVATVNGVDFREADLTGCTLEHANLRVADLRGAVLTGANLAHTVLPIRCGHLDLTGADLRWSRCDVAVLTALQARGTDFRGGHLHNIVLRGPDVEGASFHCACLQHANLRVANLRSADFSGADLRGAKFGDACLAGAQFQDAVYDGATQWPSNFDPVSHGAQALAPWHKKRKKR